MTNSYRHRGSTITSPVRSDTRSSFPDDIAAELPPRQDVMAHEHEHEHRSAQQPASQMLRGSCACGRNRYVVEIPQTQAQRAELTWDSSAASRPFPFQSNPCQSTRFAPTDRAPGHTSAAPLTFYLRVPLPWYSSATFAQHADEPHASIRRTFTFPSYASYLSASTSSAPTTAPVSAPSRRQFCGYCGTQLSSWHERTPDDARHISVTVGSLLDEDQTLLAGLGYLPVTDDGDDDDNDDMELEAAEVVPPQSSHMQIGRQRDGGAPWFEELVERSALGKIKQQRGG